jgi:YfiH family protein
VNLYRWDAPGPYDVVFTTRVGGVSEGPFASLNLGRKNGDDVTHVDENRRRVCSELGVDDARLAVNFQIHSAVVNQARGGSRGEVQGDGLWTEEPGLPLLALTADCVPIALVRTQARPAAAVLHAGRIGILAGLVEAAVATLGPGLAAAVGPAIGPCCYEVREDVAGPYRERFGRGILAAGRLDLWSAAERLLREAGCTRVARFDLCTACRPELFFSNRRDGVPRGSQGVVAALR